MLCATAGLLCYQSFSRRLKFCSCTSPRSQRVAVSHAMPCTWEMMIRDLHVIWIPTFRPHFRPSPHSAPKFFRPSFPFKSSCGLGGAFHMAGDALYKQVTLICTLGTSIIMYCSDNSHKMTDTFLCMRKGKLQRLERPCGPYIYMVTSAVFDPLLNLSWKGKSRGVHRGYLCPAKSIGQRPQWGGEPETWGFWPLEN